MNPYLERQILDAEPLELTRLLYQRVIACIRDARVHLASGRIAERGKSICHAYAAVGELDASLRTDAHPELAARLHALYAYVQQRLIDANIEQEDRPLAHALDVMVTLSEGWTAIAASTGQHGEESATRLVATA